MILQNGANVDQLDVLRWTPLMHSIVKENVNLIQFFIENGTNVNSLNVLGLSLLMIAVTANNIEIVKILTENGADINMINTSGYNSFHLALNLNRVGIVNFFLNNGANIHILYKGVQSAFNLINPLKSNFVECQNFFIKITCKLFVLNSSNVNFDFILTHNDERAYQFKKNVSTN